MGIYLNPGNDAFFSTVNYSEIYVDKTMLIDFTNKCLFGENKEICVSRPRRFGKSIAENMLAAYYSKGCDSKELFSKFKIAETPDFEKHLNQYNVIHVDMQNFMKYSVIKEMIQRLTREILFDISTEFPDVKLFDENDLTRSLKDIFAQKKQKFIFIIDEWDCIFRIHKDNTSAQKEYLDFLRDLLKGQPYVALAYMTGILPIKKYGEHSALNMFKEYSMTNQKRLAEFTGFTESEVRRLCEKYSISFEKTKQWYDGYNVNGTSIYNPKSVVEAITEGIFDNYWTQTETYEALKFYILRNENGLRDKIIRMIAGEHISVNTKTFQNDMNTFESADDVLTLLIHLGYLTYDFDTKTAWIPNKEVQQEFINSIQHSGFDNVMKSIHKSDKLLRYTLEQNAKKVSEMLSEVHNENTSVIQYNDENSLSCVLSLAYYSAQDTYAVYRELQGGEGFADLVFVPRAGNTNPAMIIELKWDKNAGIALNQIKDRQYIKSLKDYHGKVLFVGINYDKKSKKHECRFEMTEI
ncbi:MAG: AAA family ATPase [Oscillospiraceae bacterium]|nr:AAA family ATPase [Oscillospiraceae bacterium]